MTAEAAAHFFLRLAEAEGGLSEDRGESALVVLPEMLQARLGVPEALVVTADPDVAREDAAVLLAPGHPLLEAAAAAVLDGGDAGLAFLPWPSSPPPSAAVLLAGAREHFTVDHGRIDPAGEPAAAYLPVLRVGALVTYHLSLDHRFREREEVWVDAATGRALPAGLRDALDAAAARAGPDPVRPALLPDLGRALAGADRMLGARARARRDALAGEPSRARQDELDRADAYYASVLHSLARRGAGAPPDRARLLDARAEATRVEHERRRREIEEKFEADHEIRPYRLHLLMAPALVVPVRVSRGGRSFPLALSWLLAPVSGFTDLACPRCGEDSVLVAGREQLGCRSCLPRPVALPEPPAPHQTRPGAARAAETPPAAAPAPTPPARGPASPTPGALASAPGPDAPPAPDGRLFLVDGQRRADEARPPVSGPVSPPPLRKDARGGGRPRPAPAPGFSPDPARLERMGERLARDFWESVDAGLRWGRRDIAAHSPLAVLDRLYGSQGPAVAAGIPPGPSLLRFSSATVALRPDLPVATTGVVEAAGVSYPYTLRWRPEGSRAVVAEVLPFPAALDAGLRPLTWLAPDVARRLRQPPAPRLELDPVTSALWRAARPRLGLPLVARALAAWWRLRDPAASPGEPPEVIAAAVVHLVGRRARAGVSADVAAAIHGADPGAVARCARRLGRLLGLSAANPW